MIAKKTIHVLLVLDNGDWELYGVYTNRTKVWNELHRGTRPLRLPVKGPPDMTIEINSVRTFRRYVNEYPTLEFIRNVTGTYERFRYYRTQLT